MTAEIHKKLAGHETNKRHRRHRFSALTRSSPPKSHRPARCSCSYWLSGRAPPRCVLHRCALFHSYVGRWWRGRKFEVDAFDSLSLVMTSESFNVFRNAATLLHFFALHSSCFKSSSSGAYARGQRATFHTGAGSRVGRGHTAASEKIFPERAWPSSSLALLSLLSAFPCSSPWPSTFVLRRPHPFNYPQVSDSLDSSPHSPIPALPCRV